MTRLTPIFLVLLRLAIGWHFLFEGVEKLHSPTWSSAGYLRESTGPLAKDFRDMAGDPVLGLVELEPLGPDQDSARVPHNQRFPPGLGRVWDGYADRLIKHYDLDSATAEQVRTKLAQRKEQTGMWLAGQGPGAEKKMVKSAYGITAEKSETMPQRLAEYREAVKRLAALQVLEQKEFDENLTGQTKQAWRRMQGEKAKEPFTPKPGPTLKPPNVGMQGEKTTEPFTPVPGLHALAASTKADVNKMRAELIADINAQTLEMKKALRQPVPLEKLLADAPKELQVRILAQQPERPVEERFAKLPEFLKQETNKPFEERLKNDKLTDKQREDIKEEQKKKQDQVATLAFTELRQAVPEFLEDEPVAIQDTLSHAPVQNETKLKDFLPEPPAPTWSEWTWLKWNRLQWADFLVRYGLLAVGICLLIGLLTRTACVFGAGFLLMFYLAMPPLPGLPENPKAEGHYLYINKNIIEMLALLALATTYSGRWVGLDGLLHYVSPFRRRTPAPQPKLEPKRSIARDLGAQTPRPDLEVKERSHTIPLAADDPAEAATIPHIPKHSEE